MLQIRLPDDKTDTSEGDIKAHNRYYFHRCTGCMREEQERFSV
jgi:hypothetical protein